MGFLQDLGNVFHSIGHFITGDNGGPQPQNNPSVIRPSTNVVQAIQPQQQQYQYIPQEQRLPQPTVQQSAVPQLTPRQAPKPQPQPAPHPAAQLQRAPTPAPDIIQNPHPSLTPTNNPLAGPPVAANAVAAASALQRANHQNPNNAPQSTGDRIMNTIANSTARAAIGVPQGLSQLWDMITPGNGTNRLTNSLNSAAQQVDQAETGKGDNGQSAGLQGSAGNDLYKGLQVAENVVPGAVKAAIALPNLVRNAPQIVSKAGNLVKAIPGAVSDAGKVVEKAGNIVKAIPGAISDAGNAVIKQSWTNPATLERVSTSATDSKAALDSVTDKAPHEVAVGVSSANPTQAQDFTDAINQKAAQEAAMQQAPPELQPAGAPTPGPGAQATAEIQPAEAPVQAPAPNEAPTNVEPQTPQAPQPTSGRTAENAPRLRAQAEKDLDAASNGIDIGKATEHEVLSNAQLNDAANRYVQSMTDQELKASVAKGMPIKDAGDIAKAYATVRRLGQMVKAGDEEAKNAIPKILDSVEQATSGAARKMNYIGGMLDNMPKEAQEQYFIKRINNERTKNGLAELTDKEEAATRENLQKYLDQLEEKKNEIAGIQGKLDDIKARSEKGEASIDEAKDIPAMKQSIEDKTREANQLNTEVGKQFSDAAEAKGNLGKSVGANARALMLTKITGRLSDIATTGMDVAHTLSVKNVAAGLGKLYNKLPNQENKVISTMPSFRAFKGGTQKGLRDLSSAYHGNVETPDLYTAIKGTGKAGKEQMDANYTTSKASRFLQKAAHAMTNTATNLSEGLSAVHIQQAAEREAAAKGLTGDDAKLYVSASVANPSPEIRQAGQELVDEANNMNDNPLADLMGRISNAFKDSNMGKGLENSRGGKLADFAGETVRNIVAPFTHWAATAAWNGATDKNAVANFVKACRQLSFKDGHPTIKDPQEFVNQLAGLIVNGGAATGVGYALASNNMLTTHNAEGYDDEGLYLHVRGEYIPIGLMGFFAPGITMGVAAHQAFTDKGPGSMMDKIGKAAGDAFMATMKSDFSNSVIGGSNEFITQLQEMLQSKGGVNPTDVAATAGTDAAGNYIPGAASDVNTVLNTGLSVGGHTIIPHPLNPNGEAALTKATKGEQGQASPSGNSLSTAKDIKASDVNALINKVPVASQLALPRKPGVAANNLGSNVTRGDNESADQASVNKAVDQLPQNQQGTVRNLIRKSDATALASAQQTADAAPNGPLKAKAQAAADKLAFSNSNSTVQDAIHTAQASQAKANFKASNNNMKTIDGITYAKVGGTVKPFSTPMKAQQALDKEAFTQGNQKIASMNGMVYQRGSDGKIATPMEQKDYDYQKANDGMTQAKTDNNLDGYTKSAKALLGNIDWQLNHADLTDHQRTQLQDKGQTVANDLAKYSSYGGFTKPKSGGGSGSSKVTQNKIGSLPQFTRFDFSNLSAKQNSVQMPQVKLTDPETLIKKRSISVTPAR